MLRYLPVLLFSLLWLTCTPPSKLIERAEYGRALQVSSQQLRHGRIKATELSGLETSFFLLTQRDSQRVADLRASGRPDVWPEIYRLAGKIDQRQLEVHELLQELKDSEYYPSLSFYPAKALRREAAEKSALYHYANAQEEVPAARSGDRFAARRAYAELRNSLSFVATFRDAEDLSREMKQLGTTHLLLNPIPHPRWNTFDPWAVDDLLWGHDLPREEGWLTIHLEPETAPQIHYEADFYFSDLSVDQDESQRTCSTSKEIEDGFTIKKVWSEKDSAYVEVKEIRYKTVSAEVTTVLQEKEADASLELIIMDSFTKEPVKREYIWGSADWSNEYSRTSGDDRALPGSCTCISGMWSAFPADGSMLSEAVADMQWSFWRNVKELENY